MDSVIEFSHKLLREHLSSNDVAIDMTVGNGNDTLVLAKLVKKVYGFDIQKEACNKTIQKLDGFSNFEIINDSHLNFDKYVLEEFKGVIFNLGYLPGGDKKVCTDAFTVLETLKKVLSKLIVLGICIIVFYPGHESGKKEVDVIIDYLTKLNQKDYDGLKYEFINQINNPPFLVAIRRKR